MVSEARAIRQNRTLANPTGMKALAVVVGTHMTTKYKSVERLECELNLYKRKYFYELLDQYTNSAFHNPIAPHINHNLRCDTKHDTDRTHFDAWYEDRMLESDDTEAIWELYTTGGPFISHLTEADLEEIEREIVADPWWV